MSTLASLRCCPTGQLGELISGFQAVAQGFLARRRYRRAHGREDAIRVIQRNAMVFIDLYQWSWWKLYRQVRVPAREPDPNGLGGRKLTSACQMRFVVHYSGKTDQAAAPRVQARRGRAQAAQRP